jgi:hypothetical protein
MKIALVLTAAAALALGSGTAFAGGKEDHGGHDYFSGLSAETLAKREQHWRKKHAKNSTEHHGGASRDRDLEKTPPAGKPGPLKAHSGR